MYHAWGVISINTTTLEEKKVSPGKCGGEEGDFVSRPLKERAPRSGGKGKGKKHFQV